MIPFPLKFCVAIAVGLASSSILAAPPSDTAIPAALSAREPVRVMDAEGPDTVEFRDQAGVGATLKLGQGSDQPQVYTIDVPRRSRVASAVELRVTSIKPLARGDVALLRVRVRTVQARHESGEAEMGIVFQRAVSPWGKSLNTQFSFGLEWTQLEIPFVVSEDMQAGEGMVVLGFGGLEQTVELSHLELLNFADRATLTDLPLTRFTYSGREADAPWRAKALERIEDLRTAPMTIAVVDRSGQPVKGAKVEAVLVRPAFLWGTEVDAKLLLQKSGTADRYRAELLANFDTAVPGNALKWPGWREDRTIGIRAVDWLNGQGLRVRGHNVVWPGWKFTPAAITDNPNRENELSGQIDSHLQDIVTTMKGKVIAWDVVNEPMHEQDYFTYMPREQSLARWFKAVRAIDPTAQLTLNDYAMLNRSSSPVVIREFVDLIGKVRALGGPIDIIGVQGHVGQQPRAPELVLSDLDLFLPTGLPVQITEFDVNTKDDDLQADYTRDFLIAIYSHPAVNGYIQWGFYAPHHWKPDAAMFRADWSEKPNLKVWRDLVLGAWKTNVSKITGSNGVVRERGHFGTYHISVSKDGQTTAIDHVLSRDSRDIRVVLDK